MVPSDPGSPRGSPQMLPQLPDLVVTPTDQDFLMKEGVPQLIAWPISGDHTRHKDFLCRLQTSCLPHGGTRPTPTITPPLLDRLAGVNNRVEIPFLDL